MGVGDRRILVLAAAGLALLAAGDAALAQAGSAPADTFKVTETDTRDLKSVFATVRSKDRIEARVRTPGTVVTLKVVEGAHVDGGQVLALVADPKIALAIKALDARIVGLESRLANAKVELERAEQLRSRGVTPQARVDQAKTTFDVATNDLKAARAERLVSEQQVSEGQVLAPAAGRVLKVPVTEGSVVLAGESVATIAANQYVLRLELPERHARFMKVGDKVLVGARGLAQDAETRAEGRIIMVYPELQGGRVLADAEVPSLGDYFVGERARVWISVGDRRFIAVPERYLFKRSGIDYVRLLKDGNQVSDVVVQRGEASSLPDSGRLIEVLAGLRPGDTIVGAAVRP